MGREDDILGLFGDDETRVLMAPIVRELVFVEERILEAKSMPFIRVHPRDPSIQKATPASRLYRDLLAKQTDLTRIILSALRKEGLDSETSPLREYLDSVKKRVYE